MDVTDGRKRGLPQPRKRIWIGQRTMRKRAHAGIITHDHETIIYISRRLVEWKGGHVSPSLTKTAESLVNYQLKRIIIQCTATPAPNVKFISLSLSALSLRSSQKSHKNESPRRYIRCVAAAAKSISRQVSSAERVFRLCRKLIESAGAVKAHLSWLSIKGREKRHWL